MSDVTAVKEALDRQSDKFGNPMPYENFEDYRKVFAAARRWVHIIEEGPDYEAAGEILYELDLDRLASLVDVAPYADSRGTFEALAKHVVDAALADYLTEEDRR